MLRLVFLTGFLGLSFCQKDETVAAYGGGARTWTLVELEGAPFPQRATISFPEEGKMAGQAPCNSYQGVMDAPYPWFEAKDIVVTRKACPDLAAETAFFEGLSRAILSELSGDTMILSNDTGFEMIFKATE